MAGQHSGQLLRPRPGRGPPDRGPPPGSTIATSTAVWVEPDQLVVLRRSCQIRWFSANPRSRRRSLAPPQYRPAPTHFGGGNRTATAWSPIWHPSPVTVNMPPDTVCSSLCCLFPHRLESAMRRLNVPATTALTRATATTVAGPVQAVPGDGGIPVLQVQHIRWTGRRRRVAAFSSDVGRVMSYVVSVVLLASGLVAGAVPLLGRRRLPQPTRSHDRPGHRGQRL